MADPTLLFCVGATKAGTSWLYRMLHDHPECSLREVKEVHYWDTMDAANRSSVVSGMTGRRDELRRKREFAKSSGNAKWEANLKRNLRAYRGLLSMLTGERAGHQAYRDWLMENADDSTRLVADMTPAYSLLSEKELADMIAVQDNVKVVYLIRDPLDRLWSHVRMVSKRQDGADNVAETAPRRISRLIEGEGNRDILDRGDYRVVIEKLRAVVPAEDLMVLYTEEMLTEAGWEKLCAFLDISATGFDTERKVHEGTRAAMDEGLLGRTVQLLKDQYDWVAANVGPLPQKWQDNLARAHA